MNLVRCYNFVIFVTFRTNLCIVIDSTPVCMSMWWGLKWSIVVFHLIIANWGHIWHTIPYHTIYFTHSLSLVVDAFLSRKCTVTFSEVQFTRHQEKHKYCRCRTDTPRFAAFSSLAMKRCMFTQMSICQMS